MSETSHLERLKTLIPEPAKLRRLVDVANGMTQSRRTTLLELWDLTDTFRALATRIEEAQKDGLFD